MIRVLQFAGVINRHDFIDTIVQRADRARFQVGVCVGPAPSQIAEPVYAEGTPQWRIPWKRRADIPGAAWRLARILDRWKADIVHTHHYDESLIGYLATRLHRRTRLVVGRHYSDAIYRSSRGLKQKTLLALENLVNRAAARIIAPSSAIVQILTERQGVPRAKVDRIFYGFVPEKYPVLTAGEVARVRRDLGLVDRFAIANFSRLHEEKGQRFLIRAMAELRTQLPRATLLIVGEGPERPALEEQIRASGLDQVVRLLGWRRDAMQIMAAVDAVVQPTLQEAFSQVMAEALWMQKPLVITDVSGATDVIEDGINGLLIARQSPDDIVRAILRLADDEPLRMQLGQRGKAYVENHLAIGTIIHEYEAAYLKALGA
jgi:glycosyltransferase involved in cell wall biosynthesis